MATWNINDWDTAEDPKWEVTEEDTDDEFDDIALSRLGIELPECAKESPRPRVEPRHADYRGANGAGVDMTPIMNRWSEIMSGLDLDPELRAAMSFIGVDVGVDVLPENGIETCADCGLELFDCDCPSDYNYEEENCPDCGLYYEACECG